MADRIDRFERLVSIHFRLSRPWLETAFIALLRELDARTVEQAQPIYDAFCRAAFEEGQTGRYPILTPHIPGVFERMCETYAQETVRRTKEALNAPAH